MSEYMTKFDVKQLCSPWKFLEFGVFVFVFPFQKKEKKIWYLWNCSNLFPWAIKQEHRMCIAKAWKINENHKEWQHFVLFFWFDFHFFCQMSENKNSNFLKKIPQQKWKNSKNDIINRRTRSTTPFRIDIFFVLKKNQKN